MSENIYKSRIEPLARIEHQGALGMLEILLGIMGERERFDEYASLTSAGIKTYVHDWEVNLAGEDGEPVYCTMRSDYFSNYGIFESLGYASGSEIKEFNFLKLSDVVKLLAFELMQGRAMLSMVEIDGALEPVALLGVDAGATWLKLTFQRVGSDTAEERDFWGMESLQGEDEDFVNWCVVARPGERSSWAASLGRLRRDLLVWLCQHARSRKEFFHETRANYAPGLYGQERFLELLKLLTDEDFAQAQEQKGGGQDISRYIGLYTSGVIEGRRAFARRLSVWAGEVDAYEDDLWGDAIAVGEQLEKAARAYEEGASAMEAFASAYAREQRVIPSHLEHVQASCDRERDAIAALERAFEID